MAAGDDSVVFLEREQADAFIAAVKQYSSTDSTVYQTIGLGQCYKEIYLRDWNDFDFCSKTIVKDGDNWNVYRDPLKILTHKQEYWGNCHDFIKDPLSYLRLLRLSSSQDCPLQVVDEIMQMRMDDF